MTPTIMLTLIKGKSVAGEFAFMEPKRCIVGRALDCDIRVPTDELSQDVSRHHCALELDPPLVRVRDLDSLNGTFVNDLKIGQREDIAWNGDGDSGTLGSVELQPGDEVRLGHLTRLRVTVLPAELVLAGRGDRHHHEIEEETSYAHPE